MAQSNTSINQYDDLCKEVAQRYEQLHPDLKAALVSVDTAGAVYEIGKKFGLNIEQTGHLADVIGYTIIGLLPVADFINNLKDTIGIDGTKAQEIAREVNNKIFAAIREQLKKTHGEKWDERAMAAAQMANGKEQMAKESTAAPMPQAPITPKSPWEIKPDGMAQETRDKRQETWSKSVIPPIPVLSINDQVLRTETAKAAEAEVRQETRDKRQETMPMELPKTREAPQPAPIMQGPGVLREIRPSGIESRSKNQELRTETPKTELGEAAKPQPPTGLPFIKEVSKLMQTPELEKPQQPETTESRSKNQELRTETPKTDPEIQSRESKNTAESQKPSQKYPIDPYREPIE